MQKALTSLCGLVIIALAGNEMQKGNAEGIIALSIVFLAWKLTDEEEESK